MWATASCQDIPNSLTGTSIDHFNQVHKWAQVIYQTPGAGRVILMMDHQSLDSRTGACGNDRFRIEITNDEEWALAVLSYS